MQLKTYLTLGAGICVGIAIGACINEDSKIKAIGKIKKRIIFAMTGEEWKPKVKPVKKYCTYSSNYRNRADPMEWKRELEFTSKGSAELILSVMKNICTSDGPLSVFDLFALSDKTVDYGTWTKYGWTTDQVLGAYLIEENRNHELPKYKISLIDIDPQVLD